MEYTVAIIKLILLIISLLFDPEPFHTLNYTKITQQCVCLFYLKGTPPKGCFRLSFLVEKMELREPNQLGSIYVAANA